ncbi:hypothetical protein PV08_04095 [Exophiala spinifera]|uniref:Uncharacterized protein n=1 Tax=Exophiala spinifera TaxID=91928 RepID=A0A0D2BE84_9EURO|nr:uncharacterized protein PV08_04095 [Exophiala spinifera]KIW16905.1 hypothetical protein PV08_04095 [Exophiala spinifera]
MSQYQYREFPEGSQRQFSHQDYRDCQYQQPREYQQQQPREYQQQPREYQQQPREYQQQPREYQQQPREYQQQPREYQQRPREYQQQPRQEYQQYPQPQYQPNHHHHQQDPPPPAYTETRTEDVDDAISKALAWVPQPPPPSQRHHYPALPRPVCIPQIQPDNFITGPMPFYRAYSPYLQHHSVQVGDFMHFLDSITIALAPAPPFQAAQLVSNGVGMVPHHWAQATSAAVGLVAGIGSAAVSAGRSAAFLKKVNATYFEPRGLKASIKKDKDLAVVLGGSAGNHPLSDTRTTTTAAAVSSVTAGAVTLSERRLLALQGQIAPLSFDVPPRAQQQNIMDKLAAKGVDKKILKARKKGLKQAQKQGVKLSQADIALLGSDASSASSDSDSDSDSSEPNPSGGKPSKRVAKREEKRARKLARKEKRAAEKMAKESSKDAKQASKLKWIVIENLT